MNHPDKHYLVHIPDNAVTWPR
ncbi:hypothetical protein AB6H33_22570 [Providencia hangzhouensis]